MHPHIICYGIAGLGRAGRDKHLKSLLAREDARVVAVADTDADRCAQASAELGLPAYENLHDLLEDSSVDVVVLATPSINHMCETIAAFAAGKHVIVEKPMAMSIAEADKMIAAGQAAAKHLFVHHNLRFTREFTHLQDMIRSGRLGDLFHLRVNHATYMRRNDWQCLRRNGGGLLNNAGSHFLDLTLALLHSPVIAVVGDVRKICSAGDAEDHVKILLRCANGCTADLEITTAQAIDPPLPKWVLCGTHGTLTSDGKHSSVRWYDPKDAPLLQLHDGPAADRKYGNDEMLPWQHETIPAVGTDVGSFYDNVSMVLRHGGVERVTPHSVREVIRVIEEVRRSASLSV